MEIPFVYIRLHHLNRFKEQDRKEIPRSVIETLIDFVRDLIKRRGCPSSGIHVSAMSNVLVCNIV